MEQDTMWYAHVNGDTQCVFGTNQLCSTRMQRIKNYIAIAKTAGRLCRAEGSTWDGPLSVVANQRPALCHATYFSTTTKKVVESWKAAFRCIPQNRAQTKQAY